MRAINYLISPLLHLTNFIAGLVVVTRANDYTCYDVFIYCCGSITLSGLFLLLTLFVWCDCCERHSQIVPEHPECPGYYLYHIDYQYNLNNADRIKRRYCSFDILLIVFSLIMLIWGLTLYSVDKCDINIQIFFPLTFWMNVVFFIIELMIMLFILYDVYKNKNMDHSLAQLL